MLTFILVWCIIILVRNKKTKHKTRMKEKTKMRRTYERTMFIEDLTKAEIILYVFNESKYTADINDKIEVKYTGVKAWSIIEGGKEAEAIESIVDADGTTSTFRNSHVEMFFTIGR